MVVILLVADVIPAALQAIFKTTPLTVRDLIPAVILRGIVFSSVGMER